MSSPDLRKKLFAVAALALPVVVVKLATMVLGHTAATSAHAAPKTAAVEAADSEKVAKLGPLTQRQQAAIQHIETLRRNPFGRAPLHFESAPATNKTVPDSATAGGTPIMDTRPDEPLPSFSLNAVMSSAAGQRALINNQPYRVGDVIKDTTWKIQAIDASKRSVTLGDTGSDRSIVIAVDLPL